MPLLYDKKQRAIVNNESSDIIRMFNTAFNKFLPQEKAELDLYPEPLRKEIDEINEWVYDTVNSKRDTARFALDLIRGLADGVYKAGFSRSQQAYEAAVIPLFESLDRLEKILTGKDYLVGDRLTEADIRLFVTTVRRLAPYIRFLC